MKKKSRKLSYSKVPAKMFVASRVKAGWRHFETEWTSVKRIKCYDFTSLGHSGNDSLKMEEKS